MKQWFLKNKVILAGIVLAVLLPVYDLWQNGETDIRIIILSAGVALTGVLAKDLRGQWVTIVGIVGTVLTSALATLQVSHTISWGQLIAQLAILYLSAVSAPPKTVGYEHSSIIQTAKEEGRVITETAKHETVPNSL